jgi:signal recognition particle subunit SRP54
MVGRILGEGDLLSLIEKAEAVIDEDKAREAAKKLNKGNFDLEDFLDQLKQIKKLGPLEKFNKTNTWCFKIRIK